MDNKIFMEGLAGCFLLFSRQNLQDCNLQPIQIVINLTSSVVHLNNSFFNFYYLVFQMFFIRPESFRSLTLLATVFFQLVTAH